MVIGNGLIASQFYDFHLNSKVIIFASGVSNSASNDSNSFNREKQLFKEIAGKNDDKKLVYFSTCSIYDPSTQHNAYVQHKLEMEELVRTAGPDFLILRISNPIGKYNNPHTFFNYFVDCIKTGRAFEAWANADRNIIDVDDFYQLAKLLIDDNDFNRSTVNIANPYNYKVPVIVTAIEEHFGRKGNYSVVNKGAELKIDTRVVEQLINSCDSVNFTGNYIRKLLRKYFSV
ncbi:NAD-dependent epimerase/dehydratase family protein [Niabella yanshanensis]|uniref:NAD-dependent epimerase/dehydratase family protein n=1 Tax=Niabella yanshanensis TaxID=577386 RepID=A0ABZ0W3X7_9BACT|nr:NAD-dependent epimerase/dehydratase family protein [Niabella yanshanensis]WQD37333.1 NAD-dependent epimerase/dehydratase family protein [Niabella yanshanensis]